MTEVCAVAKKPDFYIISRRKWYKHASLVAPHLSSTRATSVLALTLLHVCLFHSHVGSEFSPRLITRRRSIDNKEAAKRQHCSGPSIGPVADEHQSEVRAQLADGSPGSVWRRG